MNILLQEDPTAGETEITLRCREADADIQRLLALLRAFDRKLTGLRDGETFLLDAAEVLYCDSVDKRTFLYTREAVYETPLRLYELEDRLADADFFRASKQALVNLSWVQSLRPELGGRIQVKLEGGERLIVSRQYAPGLKKKLEL